MTDIRYSGREGQITATPHEDITPDSPCIVKIGNLVEFMGAWGSDTVLVDGGDWATTLTWQEIKALERSLNLLAHVITRTGDY